MGTRGSGGIVRAVEASEKIGFDAEVVAYMPPGCDEGQLFLRA